MEDNQAYSWADGREDNMNKEEKVPYSERYEEMSKHIKGERIALLDVGCRNAVLRKYLDDSVKYYGIDIEPEVDFVQKVNVSMDKFPFESNFFDYVIISEVLEHLDNQHHCLNEIYRVLKPEGILIGTVPNSLNANRIIMVLFNKRFKMTEDHYCSFDIDEIERLLKANGFDIIELYTFHFRMPKIGEVKIFERLFARFSTYIFFKAVNSK